MDGPGELARLAVDAAIRVHPALARVTVDRWILLPYPTFGRLTLHAVTNSVLWIEDQKLSLLLEGKLK
jgi:hypothetical protein